MTDASSIGEVRRAVVSQAGAAGMNDSDAGRASIVATELATNLVRHAGPAGGTILIASEPGAVEIMSVDAGPGIADVARCFADGFSTAGTPGNGLGAVRRMSDELDLFSAAAAGAVLWSRITAGGGPGARPAPWSRPAPRAAGLCLPAPGETAFGDAWRLARADDGRIAVVIADGLGHGPLAAQASAAACKVFDANPFADPVAILQTMHATISGTRGAAVAIARIDPALGKLTYAGVGNIAGTLLAPDGASRGLFSHNGTVGHQARKVQPFEYPWAAAGLLVMHSDGLQTRWTLDKYPGLARRHPAVIAGVLYRDFRRGRDDATVVVVGPPATP